MFNAFCNENLLVFMQSLMTLTFTRILCNVLEFCYMEKEIRIFSIFTTSVFGTKKRHTEDKCDTHAHTYKTFK